MAYELDDIQKSQQIFYYLLAHHALAEEEQTALFRAYTQSETVQFLVKSQGEAANAAIERYGSVIYIIPELDNDILGYSKKQLKAALCRSNGTDRDYYLSQFAIITLLVTFYDGQGSSSKVRNYIRMGELLNIITSRLQEGAERAAARGEKETDGLSFADMLQAFEALKSDERGSHARTTKEGFLYTVLNFLEKQGLVQFVEADEMVYTTDKLDRFMDWNLLNRNHYERVLKVLGVRT